MFCENCGKEIANKAVTCVHCGCATSNLQTYNEGKGKSWLIALLLCLFLGLLGIHRFYINRSLSGVVILLLSITFFGMIISGIWVFIDFIMILLNVLNDGTGRKLVK